MNARTETPLPVDDYGYAIIEENVQGWLGSKFKERHTKIKLRRVTNDGRDQVQIEIRVENFHGDGVSRTMHGSATLTPAQLAFLSEYLSKHWERE